jgi:hypothetical protein
MATIYKDKLVEIAEHGLTFRRYYFPFGDRYVPFDEFDKIEVTDPSLSDGSWRLWGTSDFQTWFPLDTRRPARDRIFVGLLRGKSRRIGFTVEHGAEVEKLLTLFSRLRGD